MKSVCVAFVWLLFGKTTSDQLFLHYCGIILSQSTSIILKPQNTMPYLSENIYIHSDITLTMPIHLHVLYIILISYYSKYNICMYSVIPYEEDVASNHSFDEVQYFVIL